MATRIAGRRDEDERPERARWSLSRAGIINVYQYENETLSFGGGRLLLRGVNGSGKSTAMNMLLPFLITASMRRIDAAGEQTGVLKSWMLAGRDDPQPVGYLWIELSKDGQAFTCGCGVKANRSTDSLRTWWFTTDRRPGIDLALVERGIPLSDDALKVELGPEAVFSHDRRGDYRAEIRRRLFGGADLEQHLTLLNAVRNPRVGDRIDLELPNHLTAALPGLSEHAVLDAARPLDDLDEHRHNVSTLLETTTTLSALADVYRNYLRHDLRGRVDGGRASLSTVDRLTSELARHHEQRERAEAAKASASDEIERLAGDENRLREEIDALRESSTYEEGKELEGRVEDRRKETERLARQVAQQQQQVDDMAGHLVARQRATEAAEAKLSTTLEDMGRLRSTTKVAAVVPAAPTVTRAEVADGIWAPTGLLATEPFEAALRQVAAAVRARSDDVDEVRRLIGQTEAALRELEKAERQRDDRRSAFDEATAAFQQARFELASATSAWEAAVAAWLGELRALADQLQSSPFVLVAGAGAVGPGPGSGGPDSGGPGSSGWLDALAPELDGEQTVADHGERAAWTSSIEKRTGLIVTVLQRAAARAASSVETAAAAVADARSKVDELAAITEPVPVRPPWRRDSDEPCLADLVDFDRDLEPEHGALLEAALEASGLLTAAVSDDGLVLADGDLVIVGDGRVTSPLSEVLTVTLPANGRWSGDAATGATKVLDRDRVERVLDSVSTDWSADATTVVTIDGRFRLGNARGRHAKAAAEHIGATARRATLERLRAEAAAALAAAEHELDARTADHDWCRRFEVAAEEQRRTIPPLTAVEQAIWVSEQAEAQLGWSAGKLSESDEAVAAAESAHVEQAEQRDRTARTMQLPVQLAELATVSTHLADLASSCATCDVQATLVRGECQRWVETAELRQRQIEELDQLQADRREATTSFQLLSSRLATLEDSRGLPYREVVQAIELSERELRAVLDNLGEQRGRREQALQERTEADIRHETCHDQLQEAERRCCNELDVLQRALRVPGVLVMLADSGADDLVSGGRERSSTGYRQLVDGLDLIAGQPAQPTTADGLRGSLRQRRDALGSGWDSEARQPDDRLPIEIRVDGPLGTMPLAGALEAAQDQLDLLDALLTAKQDDALRGLLQGLVANEVAEKMDTARRLVEDMNRHLRKVATAHGLGVELRWRRKAEALGIPERMIDLLAKLPDLRTEEETRELRQLVSEQLNDARALSPEASYRELIATTLDYRRWHEMTVLTRWGDASPKRLGRNHRFSEGEKKLVTYLPFLAAVAVSCDALADHAPDVPRFVLLDDAMAKVSEDNHADLLGLLVDLDLDFIATSERLWGTHATVPELAITEVIRDAELGVILLEHYRWDGFTLTGGPDSPGLLR